MLTDLFLALLDKRNQQARGNPILPALLYIYCPAASGWWLAGANPEPVFDVAWHVLDDFSQGKTLKYALTDHGIGEAVLGDIEKYIGEVTTYRSHHPMSSPELSPLFPGGRFDPSHRLGSHVAIKKMGGWDKVLEYARIWAFLLYDWQGDMNISQDANVQIKLEWLAITSRGVRKAAYLPAWVWTATIGKVKREHIGLLIEDGRGHDQLRFALVQASDRTGDNAWSNLALVFGLQRKSGDAELFQSAFETEKLMQMLLPLAERATSKVSFPLRALRNPHACLDCGYKYLCYPNKAKKERQMPVFGEASLKILQR